MPNFSLRNRLNAEYGADIDMSFEFDCTLAYADIDGVVQFIRLDLLEISSRSTAYELHSAGYDILNLGVPHAST